MNIANRLTLLRICLIPVFIIILLAEPAWGSLQLAGVAIPGHQAIAGLIFAFASLTDFLDGYLARKYQLVTNFGIFFDPMADKLLVLAAMIILSSFQWIPAWVVIIIVSRELMVTGLRVLLANSNGKVMAAALPGKIKTATQMFAILFYLFNDFGLSPQSNPHRLADILIYICLFFTVYSGVEYFWKGRFVFNESPS